MINKIFKPLLERLPENNRLERIWKLAQVDFKKRYYNDRLGLLWALLNPIFRIAVYYMFFKYVFKINEENYGVMLFAGLLMWMTFAETAQRGMSLIGQKRYLIQNIQVKKIDLYISLVLSSFFGLAFNMLSYLIVCQFFGLTANIFYLFIPLILIALFMICMGVAMVLSTIHIFLKDLNHAWDIIALFGFWSSGVFARADGMIQDFPPLKYAHPILGLIMNFRKITIYNQMPDMEVVMIGLVWGLGLLGLGYLVMRRYSIYAIEKL